jgi:anti-sigma regulatory factor (Ser/Thr protein kinase)
MDEAAPQAAAGATAQRATCVEVSPAPSVPALAALRTSSTPPFAALPTAPGMARGYVRAALAAWGQTELTDHAETIASELVTNAVEASSNAAGGTGTPVICLCLLSDKATLRIECWDQAPGIPVLCQADPLAETGRGLAIIDAISRGSWGCQLAIGQPGKCVWAEIRFASTE